ncbi:polyhydroxyalkanoate synthesis regulator DNA-binding domain-containing protein [Legionella jordanis]|uniref:Polyhydroxyalkanoate synthesis repressor PhaR n=1 Tax=Legionella jordanis TaxID=456 RepID=A0A0W0VDI7_9GAMM
MTILIKKYKNRRLYDTEKSQYITIEELQHYVVDGVSFKVEDAASGKDLTNATLLQILVEMESGATQFLSPSVLRQLIIFADHPMSQSFKAVFEEMFANMTKFLQSNPYLNDYKKASHLWNQQMEQFFRQWENFFKP